MIAVGRPKFTEIAGDVGAAYRFISGLSFPEDETDDSRIERLHDEFSVRQHVCSYADAFDSKDLDRIVEHFADDGVLITNRGVWSGRDEVYSYYAPTTLRHRLSYHRVQDLLVGITSPGEEALVSAYFHAPFVGAEGNARAQFGRYFGRLERRGGRWLFIDWRISVDENWIFPKIG